MIEAIGTLISGLTEEGLERVAHMVEARVRIAVYCCHYLH